jgi:ssDNA-binding Zn-finger/Zn-ribbon topoisomerase 1
MLLQNAGLSDKIVIDLSLVNRTNYYTGIIFKGYLQGSGVSVVSGGRYDSLGAEFGRDMPSTGFGIETGERIRTRQENRLRRRIQLPAVVLENLLRVESAGIDLHLDFDEHVIASAEHPENLFRRRNGLGARLKAELADFKCEICGGDVVIRNGRFGSFYACANYPTCKFTKQKVNRIGVTCPDCGADVVAKRGRQRVTFYSCEKYPECQFSSWDIPTAETCPDCGDRLLYRKLRKTLLCRNKSCDYKRVEDLSAKEQGSENE